jgi:hypothetical protein
MERLSADWLGDFPSDFLVETMLKLRRDDRGTAPRPLASDGVQIGAIVLCCARATLRLPGGWR